MGKIQNGKNSKWEIIAAPPEKKIKNYFLAGTCPRTPSDQDRGWLVTALRKKEKRKWEKLENGKNSKWEKFNMGKFGGNWEILGNVPINSFCGKGQIN